MPIDSSPGQGAPLDDLALELAEVGSTTDTEQSTETQIPDKYKGKSVDDLITMHQNAERRLSQQGNELGEVRKLADQLIGVKTKENAQRQEPRKPVTVDALLADPEQVLTQTLATSPIAQKQVDQDQRLNNLEASVQQREFVRSYPDFAKDMQNPDFIDWIKRNPVRQQLGHAAYQSDYVAAANLWSLWEEQKQLVGTPDKANARKQVVTNAMTMKGGSSGEATPPKTYSRAKLMELRAKVADGDPAAVARWNDEEFQSKLVEAYQKGLVK